MQLSDSEKFSFEEEEEFLFKKNSHRKDFCEKIKKSWTEQVEMGENEVEIHYTGYRKNLKFPPEEKFVGEKLLEVDKIEITNEKGKKFNFYSLLLENWCFCEITQNKKQRGLQSSGFDFYSNFISKEIYFSGSYIDSNTCQIVKTFSQPMDLLNLLHEIGHSFESKELIIKRLEVSRLVSQRISKKIKEMDIKDIKERKVNFFSEKEKQDYYQYVIIPERNAWAYALGQYRELKRQGINIFPEKTSNQEILKYIRYCLSTYLDRTIELGDSIKDPKVIEIKKRVAQKIKRQKSGGEI